MSQISETNLANINNVQMKTKTNFLKTVHFELILDLNKSCINVAYSFHIFLISPNIFNLYDKRIRK